MLLLLLLLCGGWARGPLIMNKARVMNSPENRVSVRMHTYSPDMTPLHASLQFYGNQSALHGELLIDRLNIVKYRRTAAAPSPLGQHLEMVTPSGRHLFGYHAVASLRDNSYTSGAALSTTVLELLEMTGVMGIAETGSVAYDATLLLDNSSALWAHYNTALFTRFQLALSYEPDGALPSTRGAYSALARLPCVANPTAGPCQVASALRVNGVAVATRLVLDLQSPFNYLPAALFAQWRVQPGLVVQLENNDTLPLGKLFQFMLAEDGDADTIVLGSDLMHHFSQVALSTQQSAVHVWYYYTIQAAFNQHEAVAVILVVFDLLTLVCLFAWGTSYNYFVLDYIVHFGAVARRFHYFAYKQVFIEIAVLTVAWIQWLLVLLFSWNDADGADQDARKYTLIGFSATQFVLLALLLGLWSDPLKRAFNWYLPALYFVLWRDAPPRQGKVRDPTKMMRMLGAREGEARRPLYRTLEEKLIAEANRTTFYDIASDSQRRRLYEQVIKNYHDPVCKPPTALSVARNLLLVVLIFANLLLVFNFFSEYSFFDQFVMTFLSLTLTYYAVRFLTVGVILLQRLEPVFRTQHRWFAAFLALELALLLAYTALAYKYIYMPFFFSINTGYATTTLATITLVAITMVVCFGVAIALGKVQDYVERFIELLERRVLLTQHD